MIIKPDEVVAKAIHKKLKESNILKETDLSNISDQLALGNISEEDWKLMAELSLESENGEGDVKKN